METPDTPRYDLKQGGKEKRNNKCRFNERVTPNIIYNDKIYVCGGINKSGLYIIEFL